MQWTIFIGFYVYGKAFLAITGRHPSSIGSF
jgi:hypothetical protein